MATTMQNLVEKYHKYCLNPAKHQIGLAKLLYAYMNSHVSPVSSGGSINTPEGEGTADEGAPLVSSKDKQPKQPPSETDIAAAQKIGLISAMLEQLKSTHSPQNGTTKLDKFRQLFEIPAEISQALTNPPPQPQRHDAIRRSEVHKTAVSWEVNLYVQITDWLNRINLLFIVCDKYRKELGLDPHERKYVDTIFGISRSRDYFLTQQHIRTSAKQHLDEMLPKITKNASSDYSKSIRDYAQQLALFSSNPPKYSNQLLCCITDPGEEPQFPPTIFDPGQENPM